MERRYIGIDELAVYLDLKKSTIYAWVCQRRIPFTKMGGALRFDLRVIEVWLKKNSVEAHPVY